MLVNDWKRRAVDLKKIISNLLVVVFVLTACTPWLFSDPSTENDPLTDDKDNRIEETPVLDEREKNDFSSSLSFLEEKTTFLLLGVDQRENEPARSDAILLAQYDPQSEKVKLVSFMRDSFVNVPGYGETKLNHAYVYGGETLLKTTVEENFDIEVDHVVSINFDGFINMMNELVPEGIEVDVTEAMVTGMDFAKEPGIQTLKGEDLLQYVRFRHDSENDFGRVERQQEILVEVKEAVLQEIKSIDGMIKIPSLVKEATKYVETDLQIKDWISIGSTIAMQGLGDIETLRIPVSNGFTNRLEAEAGAVLQLDMKKNKDALRAFLRESQQ